MSRGFLLFAVSVLLLSLAARARAQNGWDDDQKKLDEDVRIIKDDKATIGNATMPPPERDEARRDLPRRLDDIAAIAARHKDERAAQEKIAAAFREAGEPARAFALAPRPAAKPAPSKDFKALARAHDEAQRALSLGDYPAALKALDVSLAGYPKDAQLLALRAEASAKLAQAEKAREPLPEVDANGIGMAGRRGLGFNPQAARDQLFGALPEPWRRLAPMAIVLLMAGLIVAASAWLNRQGTK